MFLKSKFRQIATLTLSAGLALALAGPASAATDTGNMTVGATVTANCTIAASSLDFGAYDPVVANASADLDVATTISVTCTSAANATITLGEGANAEGGSTADAPLRQMISGADLLKYNLFTTVGRTTVWGNTLATSVPYTGTGTATNVDVYGRVESAQNVPAGTYADTVVATITF